MPFFAHGLLTAWPTRIDPRSADHVARLFAVLSRYFSALESEKADELLPDYGYRWRFYTPPMTIE